MSLPLPQWAEFAASMLGPNQSPPGPPPMALEQEMRAMDAMTNSATVSLAQVPGQQVEWLWPGWLPRGMLVLVDGDPGLGKSFLTLDLAARLSSGKPMPPGDGPGGGMVSGPSHLTAWRPPRASGDLRSGKCHGPETMTQQEAKPQQPSRLPPQHVLLLNAEDDLGRTVQPRLKALGADLNRCHALTEVQDGYGPRPVRLPEDLWLIEASVRQRQAALVVIDPLMAFLGRVDVHRDNTVRRVLYQLKQMAERTQAAILLVRHLTKMHTAGDPLYRGGGSIGIIGAARIAWLVGRHPQDEDLRVLCRLKGNLGPQPPALAFGLEPAGDGVTLSWEGTVPFAPADLLAKSSVPLGRPVEDPIEAKELLRSLLRKGPRLVREVEEQADLLRIPRRAVRKARQELRIEALPPETPGGPWRWQLPRPVQSVLSESPPQ